MLFGVNDGDIYRCNGTGVKWFFDRIVGANVFGYYCTHHRLR